MPVLTFHVIYQIKLRGEVLAFLIEHCQPSKQKNDLTGHPSCYHFHSISSFALTVEKPGGCDENCL
jgi:hypothetical protein